MADITNDQWWEAATNWESFGLTWNGSSWCFEQPILEPLQSNRLSFIGGDRPDPGAPYAPGSISVTITLNLAAPVASGSPLQLLVLGSEKEYDDQFGYWVSYGDCGSTDGATADGCVILGILEFDVGANTSGTYTATTELTYPAPSLPERSLSLAALRFAGGTSFGETVCVTEILADGTVESQCVIKPSNTTFSPGAPGVAADPGAPGRPAYCVTLNQNMMVGDVAGVLRCEYVFVPGTCDPADPFAENACEEESVDPADFPGTFRRVCYTAGGAGGTGGIDAAYTEPQVVCYPAREAIPPTPGVPPTPASMSIEYNEGWNHGDDIGILKANFEFTFQVPVGAGGVVVGLTELLGNASYLYTKYDHAFYVTSNTYQVIERGVNKTPYIEYVSDDVFKIRREAGVVSFLVNDIVVYESLTESLSTNVIGSYVMYRGGDTICGLESTTLPNNGVGDGVLPLLAGLAADKPYGEGDGVLPLLISEASGRMTESVYSELQVITGFATDRASYAEGYGELPSPMTSYSLTGFRISQITTAVGVLWPIQGWAFGQSGGVGTGDAELPMLATLAADYEYAYGDGSIHAMLGYSRAFYRFDSYLAGYLPGLEIDDFHASLDWLNYIAGDLDANLSGNLYGGANLSGSFQRLEAMVLTGTVANVGRISGDLPALTGSLGVLTGVVGEIEGQLPVTLAGSLYGGAYITGDLPILAGLLGADAGVVGNLHGDLPALQVDSLTATLGITGVLEGDLPELEALWGYLDGEILAVEGEFLANTVTVSEYVAWVMNLAHRGVTTYSAFPFDFLIRWQGRHLMANASGVYELNGSGTQEAAIAARFRFPPHGFGTMQHKRPARAYLQGYLGGEMAVLVGADEGELYESHTSGHTGLDYWPVKMPRGVKGNHLEFEVSNVDGADFEIESVDLLAHLTGRKI